jgi:uncharacterized protein YabE (DUF348 family)
MNVIKVLEKTSKFTRLVFAAAVLCILGLLLVIFGTSKVVYVILDGETLRVRTHAASVSAVLETAKIDYIAEDRIIPNVESPVEDGDVIRVILAELVVVDVDRRSTPVLTAEIAPADILAAAGFDLLPGDRVWVNGKRLDDAGLVPNERPDHIRVEKVMAIPIVVDGVRQEMYSAAPTLGEALWENGFSLHEGDRLIPDVNTSLDEVELAVFDHARPIIVEVDGHEIHTLAAGETVGEALAQAGITPTGLDIIKPHENQPIPEDGRIEVVRVIEEVIVEMEPLLFDDVIQPAPDLEIDTIQVIEQGTYGVLANRIRVRSENGVEVSRDVEDAWEAVAPSPRVLGYGTKIVIRTLSTPYGTIEYWRAIPVYQTSYSPCNLGVDYCGEITASGKRLQHGMVGVIRSWYNMMRGWPVYVPDYGTATIEDIGAGIPGKDWVDLAYTDEEYVIKYGWTTLYFLTPVPPSDQIPWILP